jgi:uncharacterized metal-binding protein
MPDGKTHDRLTLTFLPPIAGTAFLVSGSGELTLWLAGSYLWSGFLFGPDLDIHSVQYKRWGFLRWVWLPYRSMIRHRGWLSHGPIVGTLFRLFYLGSFFLLVAIAVSFGLQLFGRNAFDWRTFPRLALEFCFQYPGEAIAFLVGLELGAMSHSLSDWLGSALKRRKRQKNQLSRQRSRPKSR